MSGRPVKEVFHEMPRPSKIRLPHLHDITHNEEWKKPAVIVGLLVAAGLILGASYYYCNRQDKRGSR